MAAFVQGIKVGLTDASYTTDLCAGWGCNSGPALLDVSEDETLYFKPGTEVTIDLPGTAQLSIFTVGKELDQCDRMDFQLPKDLVEVFKNPQLDWYTPLTQYLSNENSRLGDCGYGGSEELGNIIKFYNPPGSSYEPIGYGAGSHTNVVSDKGDYTLRYTITVTPPPTLVEKHIDPNTLSNKFETNNLFTFNKLD